MAGRGRFWPGEGGDAGGRAWDGGTPRRKPATMSGCSFAMMAVASRAWTPPPLSSHSPRALCTDHRAGARARTTARREGGGQLGPRALLRPRERARARGRCTCVLLCEHASCSWASADCMKLSMVAFRIQGASWPAARAESVMSGAVSGQFNFFLHLHRSKYQFYHSNKAYGKRIEQVNALGSKYRQMNTLCGHFIPMQANRSSFRFFLQF